MTPTWPAATSETPWHVLVVSTNPARVTQVREALYGWPAPIVLEVAASVVTAIRQALTQPPQLVIVDWALEGSGGRALVHQLARLRPALPVLAFDSPGPEGRSHPVQIWPWEEIDTVLVRWLLPRH